jgi:hypothetical protein
VGLLVVSIINCNYSGGDKTAERRKEMKRIHLERITYKDSAKSCPNCKHYEEEEGAILWGQWGQCFYNGNTPLDQQIEYQPMVCDVDTCDLFNQ